MQKQYVYYAIIGVGALVGVIFLVGWMSGGGDSKKQLPPAEELEKMILSSSDPEAQAAAARDLASYGERARPVIERTLREYQSQYLDGAASSGGDRPVSRAKAAGMLLQAAGKARAWRSMPEIFKAMESPDPFIRGRAGAAARKIMGAAFYFRANDPPEKRAATIKQMRAMYQQMLDRYRQAYSKGGS